MQDFQDLLVWRKAHQLTLGVYRMTKRIPRGDYPGLVPQLLRAAASVPANIAEGCGHESSRELGRFLQMAMASASELEYHLILTADLGLLPPGIGEQRIDHAKEVKRMLAALIKRVRQKGGSETKKRRQRSADPGEESTDH